MRWALMVVVLVVGCGADEDMAPARVDAGPIAPPDPLLGNWISMVSASCDLGVTFTAPRSYSYSAACALTDGTVGLQTEAGVYDHTAGAQLTFQPSKATCADTATVWAVDHAVTAMALTFTFSDGLVLFTRNAATGNGVATFGCFRSGVFTPAPLAPL